MTARSAAERHSACFANADTLTQGQLDRLQVGGPVRKERAGDPPKTRGDCRAVVRPCPYVACRYHLFVHEDRRGSVNFPYGHDVAALKTMPDTCSLDVAAGTPRTLEEVGAILNVNRERIRQIESAALLKFRDFLRGRGVTWDGESVSSEADVEPGGVFDEDEVRQASERRRMGRRVRKTV